MPEQSDGSHNVAVDSHPRLSGIMDTINSTLAHGNSTRLPSEFYGRKLRDIIDKVGVEEWFAGYAESNEYRALGIGAQVGDIVARMVGSAEHNTSDGLSEIGGEDGEVGKGRGGETAIKFALSGCHDTTLAAILTSLGVFDGEKWPPYTSTIALELFKGVNHPNSNIVGAKTESQARFPPFGTGKAKTLAPTPIGRRPIAALSDNENSRLDEYYVRVRYNDRPVSIPGCRAPGMHLAGNDKFCTLVSLPIFRSFEHSLTRSRKLSKQ